MPNSQFFQSPTMDWPVIKEVLTIAKYCLGDSVRVTLNGEEILNNYLEEFKGENCVELVNEEYQSKFTQETCQIYIARYDDFDSGKVFKGIVNLLASSEGTNQSVCNNLLKNKLMDIANKQKRHVQPNDLLVPIRILCNLKIKEPHFNAQTKGKLEVRSETIQPLIEPVIDSLLKINKDFFDTVITQAEEYRINLQASKQSRKSKSSGKIVKVNGLKDCVCKKANLCSLYLVEGDSAGGKLTQARDPQYDAILALRGKLLNVIANNVSKDKVLNNQVINNIANALGYKIYGPVDPEKCRYGKIFIVADGGRTAIVKPS